MNYIINVKKKAKKFIDKTTPLSKKRIYEAIEKLPNGDVNGLVNYPKYI